jgi:hypothetical protein
LCYITALLRGKSNAPTFTLSPPHTSKQHQQLINSNMSTNTHS